jgi:demethylmenaquinone methyltransferase/2-methoxy-6-polyprenyl-1,4-benzoquinol methylase
LNFLSKKNNFSYIKHTKADQIKNMFNSISCYYDMINNILSFGLHLLWRRQACDILFRYCHDVINILDVGVGTGDMSILIARRFSSSHVLGIDISEKMLHEAYVKVHKLKLHHKIELMKSDIEKLDLSNMYFSYFNVVVFVFSIRNLINISSAINQCKKLLKENGHILVVEFKYSNNLLYKLLSKIYAVYVYFIGSLISRNLYAYSYLNKSITSFSRFYLESFFIKKGFKICYSTYLLKNTVKCYLFKKIY